MTDTQADNFGVLCMATLYVVYVGGSAVGVLEMRTTKTKREHYKRMAEIRWRENRRGGFCGFDYGQLTAWLTWLFDTKDKR